MRLADTLTTVAVASVFALGLTAGGMLDTRNVVAFLDVTGDFDPRLALVLGGAVVALGTAIRVFDLHAPQGLTANVRDPRLFIGSVLFGIGWALSGYCPGPALISFGAALTGEGTRSAMTFTAAMVAGMYLHGLLAHRFDGAVVPTPTSAPVAGPAPVDVGSDEVVEDA